MGKLYWKFFIFFFLAQLTALLGVGAAVYIANEKEAEHDAQIVASPPARTMVEAATATLSTAGVDGLMMLLDRWSVRPISQVYVVNELGEEIKGRYLPKEVIDVANDMLYSHIVSAKRMDEALHLQQHEFGEHHAHDTLAGDNASNTSNLDATLPEPNTFTSTTYRNPYFRSPVQKQLANDGHQYLLFVPTAQYQQGQFLAPRPIRSAGLFGFFSKPHARNLFPMVPILAGILASFIFAALLAWYFSKPIKQLKAAFASAANGNLDERVGHKMSDRRDELADLGASFDTMASRLNMLIKSQTHLLHQVSHELRSPLARLQIAVGLASQQPDKLEVSLQRIERESMRMDSLVGELLELSRLESGVMQVEKEDIDLQELLNNIVEDARFEGEHKNIRIEYKDVANVVMVGQYDLIHRAIDNVVRNAIKYSPAGLVVEILTYVQAKSIVILVQDQGAGLPDDELTTIFEAFFRGSNTTKTDGHGVGLAIAKQVIEAHGGKILARNAQTGGLQVEIQLPIV